LAVDRPSHAELNSKKTLSQAGTIPCRGSCLEDRQRAWRSAVFSKRTKLQPETVMADICLSLALAGANMLVVMGVAIAFAIL